MMPRFLAPLALLLLGATAPCEFLILRNGTVLEGKVSILKDGSATLAGDRYAYYPRHIARICRETTLEEAAEAWTVELREAATAAAKEGWLDQTKFWLKRKEPKRAQEAATTWAETRGWKVYASTHFLIVTDSPQRRVQEVRIRMDAIFRRFQSDFNPSEKPGMESVVRLFQDEAGFQDHCRAAGISNVGAFYDPGMGELVLRDYSKINKSYTYQTLFHEANHHYIEDHFLKRQLRRAWVAEGLASYYETAAFKGGKIQDVGKANKDHLALIRSALKSGQTTPLERFMGMNQKELVQSDPGRLHYPQAWSLAHFFLHTKDKAMREAFSKYLEAYRAGVKDEEAFASTFGAVGLPAIEAGWKAYILGLK